MNKVAIFVAGVLVLILALASVFGCSAPAKHVPLYPEITAQKFNDLCETPEEVHAVPAFRFPIPAQVIRHKSCMGVDDLLVIVWPGDAGEKNLTAVKLLMLMYLEHQGEKHEAKLLKTDKEVLEGGLVVNMAFYELTKTMEKKDENH